MDAAAMEVLVDALVHQAHIAARNEDRAGRMDTLYREIRERADGYAAEIAEHERQAVLAEARARQPSSAQDKALTAIERAFLDLSARIGARADCRNLRPFCVAVHREIEIARKGRA